MTLRRLTGTPIGTPAPPQEQFAGTLLLPAIDIDDVTGQIFVGSVPVGVVPPTIYDPATNRITVNSLTLTSGPLVVASTPPANASAAGVQGTITWDGGALYVCINTNVWVKVNTATF